MLDHVTFRTHDLEATRGFFETILGLRAGPRPAFPFPGYWLYDDAEPIVHLVPGPPVAVDRDRDGIDHAAFRIADDGAMRRRLDRLAIAYSTMELPEIGERRLFLHTPDAVLIELVFRTATAQANRSQETAS